MSWSIKAGDIIDAVILPIEFTPEWYQEDIPVLRSCIVKPLSSLKEVETLTGADRENTRFTYDNHEFMLNFECYSQSVWIEALPPLSTTSLQQIKTLLSLE